MRSKALVTAVVLAVSLSSVAWGDDRWGNPHGDQDWNRRNDRNYGNVSELAREVARTADAVHREYERNNRRPNRDEARVAVALHELEQAAVRFYDNVGGGYGHGYDRDSRRGNAGTRDFENLLRAFDVATDTLRYINRRPYVDRGLDRIWSLMSQMDRYYGGVMDRYGRGGRNRYDRDDDRYGRDRYDRRDGYRPPQNN
jgi:hypothetical protein